MLTECFQLVVDTVAACFHIFNSLDPVFGITSLALTIFLFYSTARFIILPFLQSGSDIISKAAKSDSSRASSKKKEY